MPVSQGSLPRKVSSIPRSWEPEPLSVPFAQGDVIAGKYEVVGLLGAGGVAYVISALHLELGEMVAIKFLRPESLAMEDVVARFASEARAVARIKSEHVAHVLDVGALPDGAPYIVMEYLEGRDLADVLAEQRKVPIKVAVDYVLQACEALACAHALGIVHRDIKPENLYLMQQASSVELIKVLDFGISKTALGAPEASGRRAAKTMLPMGTPGYMSPEQIRACNTVDARTDIWALGCVLSELITGTSTFEAPTQVQLGAAILERDPVPLRQKVSDAPAELEALILRCLAKDPDDRFRDVAELALALYPFGPRRGRISAERCHQVLHGHSIEFNSVPPPGSTPLPGSGPTLVMSGPPFSVPQPPPLRTSTPATLSSIDNEPSFRPRKRWPVVALGLAVVSAATGSVLGLRGGDAASSPVPAAQLAATAQAQAPAAAPAKTVAAAPPTLKDEPVMQPVGSESARPDPAPKADPRPQSTRAQRAAAAAAARREAAQAAQAAAAQAKTKAAPAKRAALDDSEPDVGY